MTFFLDRYGSISIFRVSVAAALLAALLISVGSATLWLEQQSRRSPFEIPLPTGAETWGEPAENGTTARTIFYRVANGDVEAIATYYNDKMIEHYGSESGERCVRFPRVGIFENADVNRGTLPFYYECIFDSSGAGALRFTQVTIEPGVFSETPTANSLGYVVIRYEQRWSS